MAVSASSTTESISVSAGRWWQPVIGIICMSMIANLQYGWTLFVNPIDAKYQWGRASIQVAFTIFVLAETWLVPIEGWLVDRYGPRPVMLVGGILVGVAWVMNSVADRLWFLYLAAAIGGIGAGAVYGTCVGHALKWFPDRRGRAAGRPGVGVGARSPCAWIPIAAMMKSGGYEQTFLYFGVGQGGVVFLLAWFMRAPDASFKLAARVPKAEAAIAANIVRRDYTTMQMVTTP